MADGLCAQCAQIEHYKINSDFKLHQKTWLDNCEYLLSELNRQKRLIEHCAKFHQWARWNAALQKRQDRIEELEARLKSLEAKLKSFEN